jgi:hypothetical protein
MLKTSIIYFFVFIVILLITPSPLFAFENTGTCKWEVLNDKRLSPPFYIQDASTAYNVSIKLLNLIPNTNYRLRAYSCENKDCQGMPVVLTTNKNSGSNGEISYLPSTFYPGYYFTPDLRSQDYKIRVWNIDKNISDDYGSEVCTYTLNKTDWKYAELTPTPTPQIRASCSLSMKPGELGDPQTENIIIKGNIDVSGAESYKIVNNLADRSWMEISGPIKVPQFDGSNFVPDQADNPKSFEVNIKQGYPEGNYIVYTNIALLIQTNLGGNSKRIECGLKFNIPNGYIPPPTATPIPTINPMCNSKRDCRDKDTNELLCQIDLCNKSCPGCDYFDNISKNPPEPTLAKLCDLIDKNYQEKCFDCVENKDKPGIWTAVGCLPTNPASLLKNYIFIFGVGIAGGIAFLYFIYGCFVILTSGGNPEKMEQAKQIITSAISGLILIIFSVLLLKIIGVDVLGIPSFTETCSQKSDIGHFRDCKINNQIGKETCTSGPGGSISWSSCVAK